MISEADYLKAKQIVEEYESIHTIVPVINGRLQVDAKTEEYGRKCFYEGRVYNHINERHQPIFAHPTYNGYIRFLEGKKE